jgi:2-polyprenyl-3-methyl-5-hydroxy-6-metoxy-1,4-benzoquinol methylase
MEGKYFMPKTTGRCLGCGSKLPDAFLELGEMPPANSYIEAGDEDKEETFYKLAVAYCSRCHLAQITHRVDPEQLFTNYLYFSSFSNAFLKHAEAMVESLAAKFALDSNSLVMEIGSNDGYLLKFFREKGIPVLGIEPAKNIARVANEMGIPTMDIFFGPDSVDRILREKGQADIIIGNNVLAHVPLINDFLLSVNKCLKPTGSAVFESPYLKDLLGNTEFDTIYHEHVFYYSLSAINILAQRARLELYDVNKQDIHGGSVRVFLQKEGCHDVTDNVKHMLLAEEEYGIMDKGLYDDFGKKVEGLKTKLVQLLGGLKKTGNTIAAYGAAAKGNTLLNYCGIGREYIDYVVDRSPYKQGRYLPGSHIPIEAPDRMRETKPDHVLILPWNIKDEIMEQMRYIREWNGRFIIPIPKIQVI